MGCSVIKSIKITEKLQKVNQISSSVDDDKLMIIMLKIRFKHKCVLSQIKEVKSISEESIVESLSLLKVIE